jgi:hypothetical protein
MPLLCQAQDSSGWNATAGTVCDAFPVLDSQVPLFFVVVGKLGWIEFIGEFGSCRFLLFRSAEIKKICSDR